MTTYTPHQKLLQLANFLDDLPHDRFHMPTWTSPDRTETSCGTAGCACGWAVTLWPESWYLAGWGTRGLWVEPRLRKYKDLPIGSIPDNPLASPNDQNTFARSRSGQYGFAEFFDIPLSDAYWITCHLSYDDEELVFEEDGTPLTPIRHDPTSYLVTCMGYKVNDDRWSYCHEYKLDSAEDITPRHAADRIRQVLRRIDPAVLDAEVQPIVLPLTAPTPACTISAP